MSDKPKLKILGTDGNAFALLGKAKRAALKAGWNSQRIDDLFEEAMNGDYDHLLATLMENFDVS
jgi:hypothetical protein